MINKIKLDLDLEKLGETEIPLIRATGNLDIYSGQELRRLIEKNISDIAVKYLVVDAQKLEYIDSSGIGILFSAALRLKKRSGALLLVQPQDIVRMALDITKALAHMTECVSLDEALEKTHVSQTS